MLDILAPDDKMKEKYMEIVSKAQATVEFPENYVLSDRTSFAKRMENIRVPKECVQHSIKSILLKETKSKKNQPVKKVDEWL